MTSSIQFAADLRAAGELLRLRRSHLFARERSVADGLRRPSLHKNEGDKGVVPGPETG